MNFSRSVSKLVVRAWASQGSQAPTLVRQFVSKSVCQAQGGFAHGPLMHLRQDNLWSSPQSRSFASMSASDIDKETCRAEMR
eukprot:gene17756-24118_t